MVLDFAKEALERIPPRKNLVVDIETTGFQPLGDRILCITMKDVDAGFMTSFCGEDEKDILEKFWFALNDGDNLITFNGQYFDLPFIIKRCLIHKVKVKRYNSSDLYKIVNLQMIAQGKLRDWAKLFGIPISTDDGKEMPVMYAYKRWDEIKAHCEEDVLVTEELYKRCREIELL